MREARKQAANQLMAFDKLSNEACEWVTHQIYVRFGDQFERFGVEQQVRCQELIDDHLRYLRLTLEIGDVKPLIDHFNWAYEVLTTGLGSSATLSFAITSLGEFFAVNLVEGGQQVQRILQQVAGGIGKAGFNIPCQEGWPEASCFEEAILKGDRALATSILEDLQVLGCSMLDIDVFVIEPALNSIGQKWQANKVSIAQEHLATATAATAMAVCSSRFDPSPSNGKRVLLACVENNQHLLGLRMVADVMEINGWDVRFLGADTPVNNLVDDITEYEPDVVGLSVVFAHQLRLTKKTIEKIRNIRVIKPPRILLGGAAVKKYPHLFHTIGADGCAVDALAINELTE